jgi:hypothetical protein
VTITVRGGSDDLLEVDGDISEEFTYSGDAEGDLLAFSDGTVLRLRYAGRDGIWRITTLAEGVGSLHLQQATGEVKDGVEDYSDTATLSTLTPIKWVVHGTTFVACRTVRRTSLGASPAALAMAADMAVPASNQAAHKAAQVA